MGITLELVGEGECLRIGEWVGKGLRIGEWVGECLRVGASEGTIESVSEGVD